MNFRKIALGTTIVSIGAISMAQLTSVYTKAAVADFVTAPITSPIITTTPTPTVVTPTPTTAPSNNNNGGNNNGGNNNSNNGGGTHTYSCNDQKPTATPRLLSSIPTGINQITLFWTKVSGPVSHYQVAYSTKSGVVMYGLPKVGDANTVSTTINSLGLNTRYYFRVKAVNGCTPGEFSNEIAGTTTRFFKKLPANYVATATGSKAGKTNVVQAAKKEKVENKIVTSTQKVSTGFFGNLFNFFKGK